MISERYRIVEKYFGQGENIIIYLQIRATPIHKKHIKNKNEMK